MAYICTKPQGSCHTCSHFRYDEDHGSICCWADYDRKHGIPSQPQRLNKSDEFEFIVQFIKNSSGRGLNTSLLYVLWTAYCLHHDLISETPEYDSGVMRLWDALPAGHYTDYNHFYGCLAEQLE